MGFSYLQVEIIELLWMWHWTLRFDIWNIYIYGSHPKRICWKHWGSWPHGSLITEREAIKIRLYKTLRKPVLLHGRETWILTEMREKSNVNHYFISINETHVAWFFHQLFLSFTIYLCLRILPSIIFPIFVIFLFSMYIC